MIDRWSGLPADIVIVWQIMVAMIAMALGYATANRSHIAIGLLDDTTGLTLKSEIFHDLKPDCFELSASSKKYTTAETMAMFAPKEPE